MFGLFRKPRWTLQFWNAANQEHFGLESDSIGELLGYIATDLEHGRRPSAKWVVHLVHRSLNRLQIEHRWPGNENPVGEILSKSLELDPVLKKSKKPPKFFRFQGGKKISLPLHASVNGNSLISMSLGRRVELAQSGADVHASTGIFDVVRRSFTEQFGVPSPFSGQVVYSKTD